jgi:SAM-dependent methyltransferase
LQRDGKRLPLPDGEDRAQVRPKHRQPSPSRRSRHQKTGKAQFDDIYDRPDPRPYFRALSELDYEVPAHAQVVFQRLVDARRVHHRNDDIAVLDLCCSYGTNAALLNHEVTLGTLYDRYCSDEVTGWSSEELVRSDRKFFASRRRGRTVRVFGLDAASSAVRYAERAGLLVRGWNQNLEAEHPDPELEQGLSDVDLVTATGCVGYITDQTIDRVLSAVGSDPPPWVAVFALRWVDFDPIEKIMKEHGLLTEKYSVTTFPQRRFTDDEERAYVLDELERLGIDPAGRETDGRYHTDLYVARPASDTTELPLCELLKGVG